MVSFKHVLFCATVAFSAILVRDATSILANLAKIDADARQLNSDTVAWDGTAKGSSKPLRSFQRLDNDTKAATNSLANEAQLGSADSNRVVSYVSGTLSPDLRAALTTVVGRKTDFTRVGERSLIRSWLETDKTDFDSLFAALNRVLSADTKAKGTNAQTTVDSYFNSAISEFS